MPKFNIKKLLENFKNYLFKKHRINRETMKIIRNQLNLVQK